MGVRNLRLGEYEASDSLRMSRPDVKAGDSTPRHDESSVKRNELLPQAFFSAHSYWSTALPTKQSKPKTISLYSPRDYVER